MKKSTFVVLSAVIAIGVVLLQTVGASEPTPIANPQVPNLALVKSQPGTFDSSVLLASRASSELPTGTRAVDIATTESLEDAKTYMLNLINRERQKAGVPPVRAGTNQAAQIQVDNSIEHCFSAHWGLDGLDPDHRYSLADGYQGNAENVSGVQLLPNWR